MERLNIDKKKINVEKNEKLEKIKIDNIEQKYRYEEEKNKIENDHIIDMRKKELKLNEKIEEIKDKTKKDEEYHELEMIKETNKTEYEEDNLNKELLLQKQKIENDKAKKLLNIQYNQEEKFMIQEIERNKDEMLLQMLTAKMMSNL